jgi:hypothetical protein
VLSESHSEMRRPPGNLPTTVSWPRDLLPTSFFGRSLLRSMLARERREHTTCATVSGPRHRSNTTLSISRLLASSQQVSSGLPRGPHHPAPRGSIWIWREGKRREGEASLSLPTYYI